MLAVFNGQYVELDPLWHVRGVGNNNPVKDKGNTKAKETVDFAKNKAKLLHWYVHTLHHLVGVVTYKPTSEPTSTLVGRFVLKTIFQKSACKQYCYRCFQIFSKYKEKLISLFF